MCIRAPSTSSTRTMALPSTLPYSTRPSRYSASGSTLSGGHVPMPVCSRTAPITLPPRGQSDPRRAAPGATAVTPLNHAGSSLKEMFMDRRNFIRMSLLATGGAALGVSLFGCAPGATTGGKASLRMAQFGSESRMKLLKQAFAAYTARNPERSITIDPASNEVYIDKLATQVSGGNAPDLMGLYHNVVPRFARQNALLNLDDHIGKGLDISAFQDLSLIHI